jgi:hypothetical protein
MRADFLHRRARLARAKVGEIEEHDGLHHLAEIARADQPGDGPVPNPRVRWVIERAAIWSFVASMVFLLDD